jgi:glycosyltransferase involved in cell wall biosynthesis
MNIVLVTNSELPTLGGREVVVHYLAKTLKEMGHTVRVTGPGRWWKKRHRKFPYPVHRWPSLRGYFPDQVNLLRLLLDISIFGADVIHAHATYSAGFAACGVKRIRRIPVVLTPHGEDIHVVPELNHGLRLNQKLRPKIEYAVRNADVLTAISSSIKDSIVDAGGDVGRIVMIPNGTDAERFSKKMEINVHQYLGIEENGQIVLSVGNYRYVKGYESLFDAFELVLKEVPTARLVIVGRDQKKALAALIERHGVQGKVVLTGQIRVPEKALGYDTGTQDSETGGDVLAALYQSADVYVSAGVSGGAEGLSLAVLDALTSRLPVVATDISGNKDVVEDGKSGILVEPGKAQQMGEAVVCLLKNRHLAEQYGKAGYEISRQYHWGAVAMSYLEAYETAISRVSGPKRAE